MTIQIHAPASFKNVGRAFGYKTCSVVFQYLLDLHFQLSVNCGVIGRKVGLGGEYAPYHDRSGVWEWRYIQPVYAPSHPASIFRDIFQPRRDAERVIEGIRAILA